LPGLANVVVIASLPGLANVVVIGPTKTVIAAVADVETSQYGSGQYGDGWYGTEAVSFSAPAKAIVTPTAAVRATIAGGATTHAVVTSVKG
jgi:hypothetical protein